MERLTYFDNGRWRLQINGAEYADFPFVDRLAAYENTGLTPEEIMGFVEKWKQAVELAGLFKQNDVDRIKELLQAEKDGRLSIEPPNDPLTLEELREMDGEPVWIVEFPDWGHWELSQDAEDYVQDRDTDFYGLRHDDPCGKFGLHVLGWLAYRYKPYED